MKRLDEAGFTIIETMLFLGITGLMVMSILVGAGNSINFQRYRDSVNTLQSIIQQQYSDVANPINSYNASWVCNLSTGWVPQQTGTSVRGQSDCVTLGRLIKTSDGINIIVYDVIGHIPAGSVAGLDENTIFGPSGYEVKIATDSPETYQIDWNSSLSNKMNDSIPMSFSLLVLRSPKSGDIRTFFKDTSVGAALDLVIPPSIQEGLLCVKSNGLFSGRKSAVKIAANASDASDIETLGEATSGCN